MPHRSPWAFLPPVVAAYLVADRSLKLPEGRSAMPIVIIGFVSTVLASLRIGGETGEIFQAIAHLWVGALFGFAAVGLINRTMDLTARFALWFAAGLTVIETICFLLGVGR